MSKKTRSYARKKKHMRVRANMFGTATKPRLNVFKSLTNIEVQLIDDEKRVTIASVSSRDKKLSIKYGGNVEAAKKVGLTMGDKIKTLKVKTIIFDRGGYNYHGRVKALAEAVREKGVKF